MKKLIIISLLIACYSLLPAVFDDYQPSARARGMAGAYTAISDDINGIFFNPAGVANNGYEASLGYSNLNGESFSKFKSLALGAPLPKKLGNLGFGIRMLDVDFEEHTLQSEQIYSLSHALCLQKDIHSEINIGYNLNYYRLAWDDDDSDGAIGIDLGFSALLHTRTRLAFSVTNLNKAKMGFENQIDLPSKLALGISYLPYDKVTTSIEVKKDFAQETEFMGGVEAQILEPLSLRFGVHQNPATYSVGASFSLEGVKLDYAFTLHSVLAPTHYLNLGYRY